MHRKWLLQTTNPEFVRYLSAEAGISEPLAQILINRGVNTPGAVAAFMDLSAGNLCDPFKVQGMDGAAGAILAARDKGQKILIHGDYDADGTTATAILSGALRALGIDHEYFIPTRFDHGYGFNPPAVEEAKKMGASLIVTVDCGITSFEAVGLAGEAGIGVVVTDHHEPEVDEGTGRPVLPQALAIVNPKVSNPELSNLAGVGVALKLAQALADRVPGVIDIESFYDLAALGTLADSVPLVGESRDMVKLGMPLIEEGRRPGIKALKEVSGLSGRSVYAGLLIFTIVPRMNAAGRVADASEVVKLLLSESYDDSVHIARSLDEKNVARKKIEEDVYKEAVALLEKKGVKPAIVLAGEGWHEGVLGIVASKVAERYNRPAFILSITDTMAKGSSRSVKGFDVHEGLGECRDLLEGFGGHKQAAGLRLKVKMLEAFEEKICAVVDGGMKGHMPELKIDAAIDLRDASFGLAEEIRKLEPFGFGNPEPVLGARSLEIISPKIVGRNHLKMRLKSGYSTIDAIGFDMGDMMDTVEATGMIDAAFNLTINEWEDRRLLQLNLKGLRPSGG